MPDLDPLPHRPTTPVFAPRSGDFAGVVGRAKRRRRRHLGTAGAGLASVLAVVALATGNGGGTVGLDPIQPVTGLPAEQAATPSASPSPEPTAEAQEPTAAPDETAAPAGEPSAPAGDPGDEDPGEVRIDDDPVPNPEPPQVVRDEVAFGALSCDTDPSVITPAGWCIGYDGPASVPRDVEREYRLLVCRHVGRGAGTLTFETEQQVDFVVSGDREEWHWSSGYPFPERQTRVTIPEARCARWTVTWDARGDDGDLLRPGTYWMSPSVAPATWSGEFAIGAAMSYELEITA